ncbi:MAG: GAD-like domain-containing protein [Aquabacterium sp.]|jgi:hypothetical protein|uniref:GAD-like domain-containing protein n=1 Tax=Aquabacterium sp. TaxID=1872578 RepID=UPI003BAF0D1F
MDPYFDFFLKSFGPAIDRRDVPREELERFKGKLPDQMLAYWGEQGWSGYADGLFWTVNPEDYEPVLDAWLGESQLVEADALHIIARTAFGHLLIWGERSGYCARLFAPGSYVVKVKTETQKKDLDMAARSFFSIQKREVYEFDGRFAPAKHRLGRLGRDEMYGYVPALGLGGSDDVSHLEKIKAVEHLVLLAQLDELKVMG